MVGGNYIFLRRYFVEIVFMRLLQVLPTSFLKHFHAAVIFLVTLESNHKTSPHCSQTETFILRVTNTELTYCCIRVDGTWCCSAAVGQFTVESLVLGV